MSIDIPANENGVVRVFTLSMTDEQARALKANTKDLAGGNGASSLQELALGSMALNDVHVEVFPIADLGDMSLADYLVEGAGVTKKAINADRFKLSSLDGWLMIVYSSAFRGLKQRLNPSAQLTLVGTYPQTGTDWSAPVDLSTPSALPRGPDAPERQPKKRPSDAAMSGRIAMTALLIAFFVVGLMIWVGS